MGGLRQTKTSVLGGRAENRPTQKRPAGSGADPIQRAGELLTPSPRSRQNRSTSTTAWANAAGASCGMLWPTSSRVRWSYLPVNLSR